MKTTALFWESWVRAFQITWSSSRGLAETSALTFSSKPPIWKNHAIQKHCWIPKNKWCVKGYKTGAQVITHTCILFPTSPVSCIRLGQEVHVTSKELSDVFFHIYIPFCLKMIRTKLIQDWLLKSVHITRGQKNIRDCSQRELLWGI